MSGWLADHRPAATWSTCRAAILEMRRPTHHERRIQLQFEADLLAFSEPVFSALTWTVRLPQGFLKENRGRLLSIAEADAFEGVSAIRRFIHLDCPPGSVDVGPGVAVRAIFLRTASLVEAAGRLRIVSTPPRVDAVFAFDGRRAGYFASWRLEDCSYAGARAFWTSRALPRLDVAARTGLPIERLLHRIERTAVLAIVDAIAQSGGAPTTGFISGPWSDAGPGPDGTRRRAPHHSEIQVVRPHRGELL